MHVFRKSLIDLLSNLGQLIPQALHEFSGIRWYTRYFSVDIQLLGEGLSVDQLFTVVVVAFALRNVQVAGFQLVLNPGKHGELEVFSVDLSLFGLGRLVPYESRRTKP